MMQNVLVLTDCRKSIALLLRFGIEARSPYPLEVKADIENEMAFGDFDNLEKKIIYQSIFCHFSKLSNYTCSTLMHRLFYL